VPRRSGPMAYRKGERCPSRGTLWESVAVPELRGQALRVAQTLLDAGAPAAAEAAVLEYQI